MLMSFCAMLLRIFTQVVSCQLLVVSGQWSERSPTAIFAARSLLACIACHDRQTMDD
jgi:hypothetical protein